MNTIFVFCNPESLPATYNQLLHIHQAAAPSTKYSLTLAISTISINPSSSDRMDQSSLAIASEPPVSSCVSCATHFDTWELSVLEYYGSIVTHRNIEYVFCPIMGLYFHPSEMTVIRLVPSTVESRHIAYQFGNPDHAEADHRIIEGEGNGLVMYRGIADRFLNGEFIIIPSEARYSLPLRIVLLNEIIGICRIPGFQYPYASINLKSLQFKDDCWPDLRCLHWRYIINLERANNRSWLQVGRTPKWEFPGTFMRQSIIRHLDLSWARRGIPNEKAFAGTIWDGVEAEGVEFDREIALRLEQSTRGNLSGSETSRCQSCQSQYTSGTNTVSATNQGPHTYGSQVQSWWIQASTAASTAMPGTIGPIGTMPGPA